MFQQIISTADYCCVRTALTDQIFMFTEFHCFLVFFVQFYGSGYKCRLNTGQIFGALSSVLSYHV